MKGGHSIDYPVREKALQTERYIFQGFIQVSHWTKSFHRFLPGLPSLVFVVRQVIWKKSSLLSCLSVFFPIAFERIHCSGKERVGRPPMR